MALTYKQAVELAEEQAINTLFESNKYEYTKKRFYYDLAVLGIGCVKNTFNTSEGVKVEYVDPADIVYSHTDSPYFDDIYYVGEMKTIPVNELKKQFPDLDEAKLKEITSSALYKKSRHMHTHNAHHDKIDQNQVQVLYFNYKTYMNEVYKVKETATGSDKAILKDDTFNPPVSD